MVVDENWKKVEIKRKIPKGEFRKNGLGYFRNSNSNKSMRLDRVLRKMLYVS